MEKVKTNKTCCIIAIVMAALALGSLFLAGILNVIGIGIQYGLMYEALLHDIERINYITNGFTQMIGCVSSCLLLPVVLLVSLVPADNGPKKKVIGIVFAVIAALVLVLQVAGNGVNGVAEVALRIWFRDLDTGLLYIVQSLREITSIVPGTGLLYWLVAPAVWAFAGYQTSIFERLYCGVSALSNLLYILPNVLCLVGFVLSIFSGKKKAEKAE